MDQCILEVVGGEYIISEIVDDDAEEISEKDQVNDYSLTFNVAATLPTRGPFRTVT